MLSNVDKKTIGVTKNKIKISVVFIDSILFTDRNPLTFILCTKKIKLFLYRLVIQFGLQLLRVCHLPHSFHEILLSHVLMVGTNGKHTCWTKMRRGHTVGILETQGLPA